MDKRNLDIARVSKSSRGHSHDHQPQHQPIHHQPVPRRMGYWKLIGKSWRAVIDSNIFQMALLRNLLSVRAILFIVLPAVYFQLRYMLVLKPDQILAQLKNYVSPQNTTTLILIGGLVLGLILVSFIADSIINPALIRYYYQRLGSRKPKMSRAIRDSMSLSFAGVSQRFFKTGVLLINLVLTAIILYGAYIFGYGSIELQLIYLAIAGFLIIIQYSIYFYFKYWLQAAIAIGYTQGRSKIAMSIKQTLAHPLAAIGYGLNWFKSVAVIILLCLALDWAAVYLVDSSNIIWQQLLILALISTLVYMVWTIWTSWQAGYWTAIVEHKSQGAELSFATLEESKAWQFVSLIIILFIIMGSYVVLSYIFSDKIIAGLETIYSRIPENIKFNLPKPQ